MAQLNEKSINNTEETKEDDINSDDNENETDIDVYNAPDNDRNESASPLSGQFAGHPEQLLLWRNNLSSDMAKDESKRLDVQDDDLDVPKQKQKQVNDYVDNDDDDDDLDEQHLDDKDEQHLNVQDDGLDVLDKEMDQDKQHNNMMNLDDLDEQHNNDKQMDQDEQHLDEDDDLDVPKQKQKQLNDNDDDDLMKRYKQHTVTPPVVNKIETPNVSNSLVLMKNELQGPSANIDLNFDCESTNNTGNKPDVIDETPSKINVLDVDAECAKNTIAMTSKGRKRSFSESDNEDEYEYPKYLPKVSQVKKNKVTNKKDKLRSKGRKNRQSYDNIDI
eukprot:419213_1